MSKVNVSAVSLDGFAKIPFQPVQTTAGEEALRYSKADQPASIFSP